MTKSALANAVDISTRMFLKYEQGSEPSALTIQRFAATLTFPVEFFYGDTLDEPLPEGVSFRSLSSLTARQSYQAIASGTLALALSDWIDVRFELPVPDVPRYDGIDPETAAAAVRETWGLGERPISNMVHLLEAHGVRVFSLAEECAAVDAFSFWRGSLPYVFLNTTKTVEHSRMDAAHELGHLVLHAHGGPTGRQAEHEAYAFGAALLMPADSVLARIPRGAGLPQIIDGKAHWKVSALNLARRVHHLGLITEWQYRSMCITLSQQGKENEPKPLCTPETSQVLGKVFRALRGEQIGERNIAADLGIPTEELSKSVFGHMLRSIKGGADAPDPTPPQDRPTLRVVS